MHGPKNVHKADVAVLSKAGRAELVGTTAYGRSIGGVHVGDRRPGSGVHVKRTRFGTGVWLVRRGRVQAVATAVSGLAARPAALRAAMKRVLTTKASRPRPKFVPSVAQAAALRSGKPLGTPLAGTSDPRVNAALTMLCGLQVGGTSAAPTITAR